jgi:nicotinate phosphoribosyltransferase
MEHKIPVKGTFAHELVMAMAGIFGPEIANPATLSLWNKEYQGKLPVALTDTLTTEVFLQTFKGRAAEDYKTLRQDSGSPERWTDMVIDHFKQIGIDPLTRTALYSDGLDIQRVLEILRYNEGKINSAFGIGTNLTNDVGVRPLNMVIKLHFIVLENGQRVGVCKLSDDLGKISGDTQAIKDTLRVLGLTLPGGNR